MSLSSQTSHDAGRHVLESARAAWCDAAARGDLNAYIGLCTDGVVWLPADGEPIEGRTRLGEWLRRTLEVYGHELRLEVGRSIVRGPWASETGVFTATLTQHKTGEVRQHRAHYALVWKRERGAWRIDRYVDLGPAETVQS